MNQLRRKNKINHELWITLLLIAVVCIAYGIGITKLSFYGDDWIYIYNYHIAGAESFSLFTQWDRPHSAWIYILTTAIFKESALAYHIFVLILRLLSTLIFQRILADTFHNRSSALTAALLFAVYPGFQQQPIAVEFVMHFTSLTLVLLSIYLMQLAWKSQTKGKQFILLIVSIAFGTLSIFTCEYFIGLELSRPFFLFFYAKHNNENGQSPQWKRLLLFLTPFFIVTVFFFIWRIFIFSFTTYEPKLLTAIQNNPINGIKLLIQKIISDIITVFLKAYRLIFSRPADISFSLAAVLVIITAVSVFLLLYKLYRNSSKSVYKKQVYAMLFTGCMLTLLSGIPFWGTFLEVSADFPWDRSTLSFSPGAAIIISILLDLAFKPIFFCAASAVITALSVLFQVQNTMVYIYETEKMNDYFWQLAWRAPGLEKGTIIASENIPLDRTSDNDLSPVLNWQYVPENRGLQYDYKYFDLHLREGFYYTDPLQPLPVDHTYRTHGFVSSTDKTLGVFYKRNGCLQIIDRTNTGYPDLPDSLIHIAVISDPNLIITDPAAPSQPPEAIGEEPVHGYCYYFQKTTLAQNAGDKDAAYLYAKETLQADLHPVFAPDMAPLILAFLEKGDIESAELMISATPIGTGDVDYLCNYWQSHLPYKNDLPEIQIFYQSHGCK